METKAVLELYDLLKNIYAIVEFLEKQETSDLEIKQWLDEIKTELPFVLNPLFSICAKLELLDEFPQLKNELQNIEPND
jgi:hypothetical protein